MRDIGDRREQALKIKSKVMKVSKNEQEMICFHILFTVEYDTGEEREVSTFDKWYELGSYPTLIQLIQDMATLRDAYKKDLQAQNQYSDIIEQEYEDDIG